MVQDNLAITVSDQCYRALLYLYPRPFRRAYGREMALAFRDYCRRVDRREGTAGLLELWLVTIADLCATALKERLTEVTDMSNATFTRLCGIIGALGGIILLAVGVAAFLSSDAPDWSGSPFEWVVALYGPAMLLGLVGYYTLRSYEPLGRIGLGLAMLGTLALSVGTFTMFLPIAETSWGWSAWFGGTLLQLAGLVVFGISIVRSNALPQGNIVPLLAGALPLVLAVLTINNESAGWGAMPLLLSGASWIALGVLLARAAGEETAPMSPAV